MSMIQQYIEKRMARDPEFAEGFEVGYANFKTGVLLRQVREAAGFTQEDVAEKLRLQKSAVSRMENHAEQFRLSLLNQYAQVLGKSLYVRIA